MPRSTQLINKKAALHIGDKIPDDTYSISNYKTNTFKFSDFKGKLVILDLWAIYCSSCIDHMPDVQKLQAEFSDKVQFVMVTKNNLIEVAKLAKRSENVKHNRLPSITGEQKVASLFDYTYVPTHVWIDQKGIIKYITSGENTTFENIAKFLAGKDLSLKEKETIKIGTSDIPLMIQMYPYFGTNFNIYSYFAPRDDSNYTMGGFKTIGLNLDKRKILSGNNFTFQDLYKIAYGYSQTRNPLANNRVIIDFKDTAGYSNPTKNYVYEVIANTSISTKRIQKYIQSQLDVFYDVRSSIQKRLVSCYVLKQLPVGFNGYTSKVENNHFQKVGSDTLKVTMTWGKFMDYFDGKFYQPPLQVIDETNIGKNKSVDFKMSLDFNNISSIQNSLAAYGLTITQEERVLDCIEIKQDN